MQVFLKLLQFYCNYITQVIKNQTLRYAFIKEIAISKGILIFST